MTIGHKMLMMASGGGGPPETGFVGNIGELSSASPKTSFTFANVPIGKADENRVLALTIMAASAGGSMALNTVSVNGVSATRYPLISTAGCGGLAAIAVPAGDTATITVTFSVNCGWVVVGIYALYEHDTLPHSTASAANTTATTKSMTLSSVIQDSFLLAALFTATDQEVTWTGCAEDASYFPPGANNTNHNASRKTVNAGNRNITATWPLAASSWMVGGTWSKKAT